MDLGLKGKIVTVTGATAGIGLATARLFVAEGAHVATVSRSSRGPNVGEALQVSADLFHAGGPERAIGEIEATLGHIENTTGTQAPKDLPLPMRVAAKYVMPALGLAHKLDVGAKRLVDGVTDPTLSSGAFYASGANTLTGPLVNQADFLPDLANPSFQDHANEAIHRFIT